MEVTFGDSYLTLFTSKSRSIAQERQHGPCNNRESRGRGIFHGYSVAILFGVFLGYVLDYVSGGFSFCSFHWFFLPGFVFILFTIKKNLNFLILSPFFKCSQNLGIYVKLTEIFTICEHYLKLLGFFKN